MRTITTLLLITGIWLGVYSADNPDTIICKTTRWIVYKTTNSKLPNNNISSMYLDVMDNFWIGTQNGLVIANDTLTKVLHVADGLADEKITCIYVDGLNWAWIGHSTKGVTKYKEGSPTVYYSTTSTPVSSRLNDINVTGIAEFSSTNFWFSTVNGGLNQLQGATMSFFNTSTSPLTTNYTSCIKITPSSVIWFGTIGKGLWKRYSSTYTTYDISGANGSKMPNNSVRCIYVDAIDRKLVGTDGGLVIIDGSNNWTVYTVSNSGLPSNRIKCILPDLGDNLWVGTDSGLVRYDGTVWHQYNVANTDSGLPFNAINCIAQDDSAYLWVGTSQGLTKLKQRCFNIPTNTILCAGDSMSFEIKKVTSATSTFQWQVNIGGGWSNVSDGGVYSGALTRKLSLNGAGQELDSAVYRCVLKFTSLGYDTSNADTLHVYPKPSKPTINKLGDQLFTDPAPAWQWYYYSGNILIPGAVNQGHIPGLSRDYVVEVSNSFGCKTRSDPFFAEGNALENQEIKLVIYPNPSAGRFVISGNTGTEEINTISVINNLGKTVYMKKNLKLKGDFSDEIILSDIPAGIYYIKINSGSASGNYKMVIDK